MQTLRGKPGCCIGQLPLEPDVSRRKLPLLVRIDGEIVELPGAAHAILDELRVTLDQRVLALWPQRL